MISRQEGSRRPTPLTVPALSRGHGLLSLLTSEDLPSLTLHSPYAPPPTWVEEVTRPAGGRLPMLGEAPQPLQVSGGQRSGGNGKNNLANLSQGSKDFREEVTSHAAAAKRVRSDTIPKDLGEAEAAAAEKDVLTSPDGAPHFLNPKPLAQSPKL